MLHVGSHMSIGLTLFNYRRNFVYVTLVHKIESNARGCYSLKSIVLIFLENSRDKVREVIEMTSAIIDLSSQRFMRIANDFQQMYTQFYRI